ncbi:hypothetical protein TRIP_C20333 [Candidatus Zixiibacteriota bacterium]|nr:hypothetical protein TRIP_C20333 [candidate division Zixibacteria bacterium]
MIRRVEFLRKLADITVTKSEQQHCPDITKDSSTHGPLDLVEVLMS